MPWRMVLAGGNEFRTGCEEMDRAILRAAGPAPARVLIVPTAAVTGPQKAAQDGVRHFARLGADSSELMVLDRTHADDHGYARELEGATMIYFTGGSPDHLLATLRGSRLYEKLEEQLGSGAILAGSSAGAMVMGSMMIRPSSREWTPGLGCAGELGVLPHHENSDPARVAEDLASNGPKGLKVLGIDAMTCCFGAPGSWTVLGPGKVTAYMDGTWTVFSPGESLPPEF